MEIISAAETLQNLKNSTGLSWKKIAELFMVSPRAIYDWLEGKQISDENYSKLCSLEEALGRLRYSTPFQDKVHTDLPDKKRSKASRRSPVD
jgi:transcriptional regulator with XRE-family HTH domain